MIDYQQLYIIILYFLFIFLYIWGVSQSNKRYETWPNSRILFWVLGIACLYVSLFGPLAEKAHVDFTAHMLGHLLLGMLGPLLLVLAAPMTLMMRLLPVSTARKMSLLLRSKPISTLSHPVVAALLNMGGLWLLYTTHLYSLMHHHTILYLLVHLHVFLAGYLFTAVIICIDPTPHRYSFVYRAIVLVISLASHGILSKYIYAHPPTGVPLKQAELGGMLMYYGGDLVDLILIYLLCLQWYRSTAPRMITH